MKMPEPAFRAAVDEPVAYSVERLVKWKPENSARYTNPLYTSDQLEAYAAARVAEEMERCAKLCKHLGTRAATADDCAAAIRGEKET